MSTQHQNLSHITQYPLANASQLNIAIAVAEWNSNITFALLEGAKTSLVESGVLESNIHTHFVSGAFELIFAAQALSKKSYDAVIVLGCVVRGGTPHFEYVCQGTTLGIAQLNASQDCPIIFGLLTTDTMEQAEERAGGIHGNKGIEASITALKTIEFKQNLN